MTTMIIIINYFVLQVKPFYSSLFLYQLLCVQYLVFIV